MRPLDWLTSNAAVIGLFALVLPAYLIGPIEDFLRRER